MMLEQAILVPIAVGALLWIMDMLLPEGRVARTAAAVAGVLAVQALLLPALMWLAGLEAEPGGMSIPEVMTSEAGSAREAHD
ncbi:MAG: hypothetical protein ACI4P5_08740 [Candidatus Fimadaptatus sp.]